MGKRIKGIAALCLLAALLLLSACGGSAQSKAVDMQGVYDELKQTVDLPAMQALSEKRMSNYYGIDASSTPQAILMVAEDGLRVDEIWLIETASEDEAARLKGVAESRIAQLKTETENYLPDQYAVLQEAKVICKGSRLALFISPESAKMAEIFQSAIG